MFVTSNTGPLSGIGLADFTTRRTVEKIDLEALAVNAIAAMTPEKGRIPIALETDRGAVEAALQTIGAIPPQEARLVHIKNTLELAELEVSKTLLPIVEEHSGLEMVAEKGALAFDEAGNLNSNW